MYIINQDYKMEKRVGEYRVRDEVLGIGAFSTVYSALSPTNRKVAVKVIPQHNIREHELSYFERQINLLKKCHSEWIVEFIDFKKTKSNFYIFLEYCEGGNLAEHLTKHQRLQETEALHIFCQLVRGMWCMRTMNIIHRDLKPANIMFKNGKVKIGDFGLACKFYHGELIRTYVGSPLNMAPEVLKGIPYTDKVDVYSAGTILYEMLFGMCPFEARNRKSLIEEIDRGRYQSSDEVEVSAAVRGLLKEMLEPEPEKRIQLAELLDFVQSYERQTRQKMLQRYKQLTRKSTCYGAFGSIAAPFNQQATATNLDIRMCAHLLSRIKA